jgi:hypothetical protein
LSEEIWGFAVGLKKTSGLWVLDGGNTGIGKEGERLVVGMGTRDWCPVVEKQKYWYGDDGELCLVGRDFCYQSHKLKGGG